MSSNEIKQEKSKEILLLFIGFIVFFSVHIFVPEEVKILRITGFLLSTIILITSFLLMLKKRRDMNKSPN